ncbi:immunoglobulin kappa light chain-like [Hemibagrus wyckioides]|uniref:immunoglobulin kappa light chain-like n=1 Tax=Hemibagrus wyckioides TaxID=337641 RepID=UPI00266B685C|nr:immunoglobulin kappa light chain-like [Hemibagrus wyckioides]
MVMLMWITVVLFSQTDSLQINAVYQPNTLITAASGDNVTLQCFRTNEGNTDAIIWYKQAPGQEPCVMVTVHKLVQNHVFEDEFKSPRFTVENLKGSCNLKISNVEPSDEAVYYCGLKIITIVFGKGTFLAVKDDGDVKVSVWQHGMSDSVPAGASVTLQCSVLSESRAAELQVLWFRAAAPQSHPQIIYTHHNSSHQCESGSSTHTCVYNFTKNILSLNDTGTYYCAVALCGKIVIGNGTPVQLENFSEYVRTLSPAVIYLTVAVAVCVVVIFTQAFIIYKIRNSDQSTVRHQQNSMVEKTPNQGHGAVELNYSKIVPKKNSERVTRKRDQAANCVYSEVLCTT